MLCLLLKCGILERVFVISVIRGWALEAWRMRLCGHCITCIRGEESTATLPPLDSVTTPTARKQFRRGSVQSNWPDVSPHLVGLVGRGPLRNRRSVVRYCGPLDMVCVAWRAALRRWRKCSMAAAAGLLALVSASAQALRQPLPPHSERQRASVVIWAGLLRQLRHCCFSRTLRTKSLVTALVLLQRRMWSMEEKRDERCVRRV